MASVAFGPVVSDDSLYSAVCRGLADSCRAAGLMVLRIVPPCMEQAMICHNAAAAGLRYEHSQREINWSSLHLALDIPADQLLASFSENHRRSIRKAVKLGLHTELLKEPADLRLFAEQYVQMYRRRGLPLSARQTLQSFQGLFELFSKENNGFFMLVRSESGNIMGGICICYQGDTAFYYKGYTHTDQRHIPVTHLAIFNAMQLAAKKGSRYFDLGGYAQNTIEGDQLSAINRFKDGFRGKVVSHPDTMLIYTLPLAKWLYSISRQ